MRSIRRGLSAQAHDFDDYRDAFGELVSRLGSFCSYCERAIPTNLAVEHIQPKALPAYAGLKGRWDNFLLGCVNCNSTKKEKDVVLSAVLLPDRDNTFVAYEYAKDGALKVSGHLSPALAEKARALLAIVGLDKRISAVHDANGKLVASDRVSQRMQAWLLAETSRDDLQTAPSNQALRRQIVRTATATGFFSIWMKVFEADQDMRIRLIEGFSPPAPSPPFGTRGSGCFDASGLPVTPAPNPDQLADGGKS